MTDFEKLGVFYLGREYDLDTKQAGEELLYDSKDLVTHAVCVGMTGSGKTGLCISLLEEAALDGVPAIVIDPKGDLANLLLTFPELRSDDFRPWINEEDAARKGLSPDAYAADQAKMWREGLAQWGQDGARITRLKEAADFAIFTPGSDAGLPVSVLASFAAPSGAVRDDAELLRERVTTTVTGLLALLGIEADPLQSREHILLSTILAFAWQAGRDLDLPALIQQVQAPPVTQVGVLGLESFYPAKDRFGLAMLLNNLLAAPGFQAWTEGEPLDVARLLATPEGRPRVAVFSIAHLADAERMFFVSLLLNEVLGWVRSQTGTTSLRAVLYMDEIFGFFPPVANPPSKIPLLTLLKQARAFGVGVVLATQNPVDLDYKGLSNAGTWFIGRLQTERDKERVLEGLEGAAAGAAASFERGAMKETLAGLGNRVFLMYNTHEDGPVIFTTRWTLSYLRGPLTREQIKVLMEPRKQAAPLQAPPGSPASAAPPVAETGAGPIPPATVSATTPPALPPAITQRFLPVRGQEPPETSLHYRPSLLGVAKVHIADTKSGVEITQEVTSFTPVAEGALPVDWDQTTEVNLVLDDLETGPAPAAIFAPLPSPATDPKRYDDWRRDLAAWLYRTRSVDLMRSPSLKVASAPGESEGEFRVRLGQAARELRDQQKATLQERYAPKLASLDERIRKAEQAVAREEEQAHGAQIQTAISMGTTLLGAFLGRKKLSATALGRATTTARGVGRSLDQAGDVGRAEETVAALQQQKADLEAGFQADVAALETKLDPMTEALETFALRPRKSDVAVELLILAWVPYWQDSEGRGIPATG